MFLARTSTYPHRHRQPLKISVRLSLSLLGLSNFQGFYIFFLWMMPKPKYTLFSLVL